MGRTELTVRRAAAAAAAVRSSRLRSADAAAALRAMQHVAGGDPFGVRTIRGARAAYVRGDIELDEFERRVELFLLGEAGEVDVVVVEPGERLLGRSAA